MTSLKTAAKETTPEEGLAVLQTEIYGNFVQNNLVLYSVLFHFGHICRRDQCAVYILYSKISTDPGLLKIRHSHRFVAVVIQFLILLGYYGHNAAAVS